jgi:hypothetical protein
LLALVENKEAILAAEHDLLVVCRKDIREALMRKISRLKSGIK